MQTVRSPCAAIQVQFAVSPRPLSTANPSPSPPWPLPKPQSVARIANVAGSGEPGSTRVEQMTPEDIRCYRKITLDNLYGCPAPPMSLDKVLGF